MIDQLAAESGVPAVGIAAIQGDIIRSAITGVRHIHHPTPVATTDRFHIGSVTKSMTATVVGRLVELGKLDWDDTLGKVFRSLEMLPTYRSVTIEQILQNYGGFPHHASTDDANIPKAGTAQQQRSEYVQRLLKQDPENPPGSEFQYSNAGYALAGHAAECVAGDSWENLVRKFIFEPLEMNHSGFGWPTSVEPPEQPLGHFQTESGFQVQDLTDVFPQAAAPAGNVHCSINDLAKYAHSHLKGLRG